MTYQGKIKLGIPHNTRDEIHFGPGEIDYFLDIALTGHYKSASLTSHTETQSDLEKIEA